MLFLSTLTIVSLIIHVCIKQTQNFNTLSNFYVHYFKRVQSLLERKFLVKNA